MKTLNNYIVEWKASSVTASNVTDKHFIYEIKERMYIKIFDNSWPQFSYYKDKVYLNDEQIKLDSAGSTRRTFDAGTYMFEIKDLDHIEDTSIMFWCCRYLKRVPLFDTSNVENMGSMFQGCKKLIDVPLFNTSNVKDFSVMFEECENLVRVPKFDTSNAEDISFMFSLCKNLRDVPLFDTHKVKDMRSMFQQCKKLNEKSKKEWSTVYDFVRGTKK